MKELLNFWQLTVSSYFQKHVKLIVEIFILISGLTGLLYGIYSCVSNIQFLKKYEASTEVAPPSSDTDFISSATDSSLASPSGVVVYVSGAVKNPGLYQLPDNSRIFNALERAGGLTPVADSDFIQKELNLAEKVKEGQKIYFPPTQKETDSTVTPISQIDASSEPISINSASAGELDRLPGIGEKLAEKIIGGRPYETIDELRTRIKVGQSVFDKIKEMIKT